MKCIDITDMVKNKDITFNEIKDQILKEYTTKQLLENFEVLQFMAPYVYVIRKKDGKKGTLQFNHSPRIYYDFKVIK